MPLICRTTLQTRLYMYNCFTPSTTLRIKSVLSFIALEALRLNERKRKMIVLLESRIPGRSLDRFNLIALGDLVDSLIPDTKRQIFPNGRNQAKIFCDGLQVANILVESSALQEFGVHAYIPASLVQKGHLPGLSRRSTRPQT